MTDNQLDRSQDSQTYYYDTAQRFTKMDRGTIGGTPSFYQGYTLDGLANWSTFNNNGSSESRTHSSMNAVTVRGATNLTYDANGNLTNDGNQKYIWDSLNRLIEVRDSSNNIICDYYYNADNLRVEKHHAGGAKEQYYYDRATVLVETDGSQTKVREYVNGGQYIDEVILVVNGSTYNYYMSDLRYCVTGFIDSTGNVVERARYDGYGKRTLLDASYATITTANVNQSYGYTGIRHDDESGLQYYRARYFDNTLGRFINHDPLGYVDGMNLYRGYFVVNSIDPSGQNSTTSTFRLSSPTVNLSLTYMYGRDVREKKFDRIIMRWNEESKCCEEKTDKWVMKQIIELRGDINISASFSVTFDITHTSAQQSKVNQAFGVAGTTITTVGVMDVVATVALSSNTLSATATAVFSLASFAAEIGQMATSSGISSISGPTNVFFKPSIAVGAPRVYEKVVNGGSTKLVSEGTFKKNSWKKEDCEILSKRKAELFSDFNNSYFTPLPQSNSVQPGGMQYVTPQKR